MLRVAEAEAVRERAMVDEIVRRIQQEDVAEVSARKAKQDETKAYIAQFLEETRVARQVKREADAAEVRLIGGVGCRGLAVVGDGALVLVLLLCCDVVCNRTCLWAACLVCLHGSRSQPKPTQVFGIDFLARAASHVCSCVSCRHPLPYIACRHAQHAHAPRPQSHART